MHRVAGDAAESPVSCAMKIVQTAVFINQLQKAFVFGTSPTPKMKALRREVCENGKLHIVLLCLDFPDRRKPEKERCRPMVGSRRREREPQKVFSSLLLPVLLKTDAVMAVGAACCCGT